MDYTDPILLTGDMIASLANPPTNNGNPGDADFGMNLSGVTALAGSDTLYRLDWFQNTNETDTELLNGQFWRLDVYDPASDPDGDPAVGNDGWTAVPGYEQLVPKSDLVNGLGSGDEYIVLEGPGGFLLYDLNGELPSSPTDLTYFEADTNGDPAKGDNDGELDFADAYGAICFCRGTSIDTPTGPRAIETLGAGDHILTLDCGAQTLRWIGRRRYPPEVVKRLPNLWPIRIRQGALGGGTPHSDLFVSPQHRVLVRSRIAQRMFGADEVLVAAKHLLAAPGFEVLSAPGEVEYYHLMFDRHEVVFANGAAAESLFAGTQAMKSVSAAARAEILTIFPSLGRIGPLARFPAARVLVQGRQGRSLIRRHLRNNKPLVEPALAAGELA
ncbi:MAG: Hint domain-containing protein [Roseovarius sp.]|nr:Hint domain-containing protein [Roseovarius sp.]